MDRFKLLDTLLRHGQSSLGAGGGRKGISKPRNQPSPTLVCFPPARLEANSGSEAERNLSKTLGYVKLMLNNKKKLCNILWVFYSSFNILCGQLKAAALA